MSSDFILDPATGLQIDPRKSLPDGVADGTLTAPWTGTAKACAGFSNVIVEFIGIAGGDSYTVNGSLAGVTYRTLMGINVTDNTTPSSITADGIYSFPALGFVTFTKTGSASAPTVNLLLKR